MATAGVILALTYLVVGLQCIPRLHLGCPAGALLGAVANVIVFEGARREGVEVGFVEYLRVGIPVSLGTIALAWAWLAWL